MYFLVVTVTHRRYRRFTGGGEEIQNNILGASLTGNNVINLFYDSYDYRDSGQLTLLSYR